MANPLAKAAAAIYTASKQLISGQDFNAVQAQLYSVQSLTASTTQTQAGATANAQINAAAVAVTTGNANDVVALPAGYAGLQIFIANLSSNALGVFPSGTDTIDAGSAGAVASQTASKSAIYKCIVGPTPTTGAKWYKNLSA